MRSKTMQLWRADIDGSNPKQLTNESGVNTASVSPDGRWVIYTPLEGGIKKVSIDGGTPVKLRSPGSGCTGMRLRIANSSDRCVLRWT